MCTAKLVLCKDATKGYVEINEIEQNLKFEA